MTLIRLFRDDGSGGGGGATPSMDDILNGNQEGLEQDGITLKAGFMRNPISGIVSKNPDYKDPNPGMKPTPPPDPPKPNEPPKPGETEGLNKDGTLKDGYIRDAADKIIKDPNYKPTPPPAVEGLNDDGTVKEGWLKNADGTITKDPAYEDVDEDDTDGTKFVTAVDNITGIKYNVPYPQGMDINSPEGVAVRETFIRESGAQAFENYLKQTNPRGYAYLIHSANGGKDADFFNENRNYELPTLEVLKASADVQVQIYTQDLMNKGLDAPTAKILTDAAVKDNTIAAKSEAAWTGMDKAIKDQLKTLELDQAKAEKEFTDNVAAMTINIAKAVKDEISFLVPEAEQPIFQKYVLDNLRWEDGNFFLLQQVDPKENFKSIVEALFFMYKKGDLSKIVTKQVQTKASQQLRRKLTGTGAKPGAGGNDQIVDAKNLPLSAILPTQGQSQ